jgi:hypothetical protein
MLKIYAALPMIVLGGLLAAPLMAQDLEAPPADAQRPMKLERNLDVRPRGQRDQTMPRGDAYSTEEPEDEDLDGEGPDEVPHVKRKL